MTEKKSKKYWEKMTQEARKEKAKKNAKLKAKEAKKKPSSKRTRYDLGAQYPDIYLSPREAELISYMLAGSSGRLAAKKMALSQRTVEYYIGNMRRKLECENKFELLEKVYNSEFELLNIDE